MLVRPLVFFAAAISATSGAEKYSRPGTRMAGISSWIAVGLSIVTVLGSEINSNTEDQSQCDEKLVFKY